MALARISAGRAASPLALVFLCLGASGSDVGVGEGQYPSINVIADQPLGAGAAAARAWTDLSSQASVVLVAAQEQERAVGALLRDSSNRLEHLRTTHAVARSLLRGEASISAGASLRARSPPAETLAGLIDGVNKQAAGSERRGRAFRDSFAASLGVPGKAADAVAPSRIAALSERLLDDRDGCVRDWMVPCPNGWTQALSRGEVTCSSPRGYSGGCATVQSFAGADKAMRAGFAEDCDAPWPCVGACAGGADFDGCPSGWTDVGAGFCSQGAAPADARCPTTMNFAELGAYERDALSRACSIEWPCNMPADEP